MKFVAHGKRVPSWSLLGEEAVYAHRASFVREGFANLAALVFVMPRAGVRKSCGLRRDQPSGAGSVALDALELSGVDSAITVEKKARTRSAKA